MLSVSEKGHQLAEQESEQRAASAIKAVLSPAQALYGSFMGDNLGLRMLGHPLFQKTRMVIMSMGQKNIEHLFGLDLQFIQPFQDFGVAVFISGINHHPTALDGVNPGIHNSIACVLDIHGITSCFLLSF
jgi:hypothetical protein